MEYSSIVTSSPTILVAPDKLKGSLPSVEELEAELEELSDDK